MINPVVQIDLDTVNIRDVNVFSNPQNDYENAKKNIESMDFNYRPYPSDGFTEQEMVQEMVSRENKIMHSEATSLKILEFSPSDIVGPIRQKVKNKKESNQYSSEKKK